MEDQSSQNRQTSSKIVDKIDFPAHDADNKIIEQKPKKVPASVKRKASVLCISIEVVALALVIAGLAMEIMAANGQDNLILAGFIILLFGLFIAIADAIWFFSFVAKCGKIEKDEPSSTGANESSISSTDNVPDSPETTTDTNNNISVNLAITNSPTTSSDDENVLSGSDNNNKK